MCLLRLSCCVNLESHWSQAYLISLCFDLMCFLRSPWCVNLESHCSQVNLTPSCFDLTWLLRRHCSEAWEWPRDWCWSPLWRPLASGSEPREGPSPSSPREPAPASAVESSSKPPKSLGCGWGKRGEQEDRQQEEDGRLHGFYLFLPVPDSEKARVNVCRIIRQIRQSLSGIISTIPLLL